METYIVPDEQKEIYFDALPDELHEGLLNDEILLIGVVDEDGVIRGVLATDITTATWKIVYIIVDEDYRRRGIGSSMLLYLDVAAMGLLAESVTVTFVLKPYEDDAIDIFFENMLCPIAETSNLYRVRLGDLKKKLPKRMSFEEGTKIVRLKDVSTRIYNEFRNNILKRADSAMRDSKDKGLYIDPHDRSLFDEEFSYLYLNKNNQPMGGMLCSRREEGISIDYMCMLEDTSAANKAFVGMIVEAGKAAGNIFGPELMIYVNTATNISKKLFLKVTNGSEELYAKIIERKVQ